MNCIPLSDETKTKMEVPKGRPDLPKSLVKYRTIKLKCSNNIKLLEQEKEEEEEKENEKGLSVAENEPVNAKEPDLEMQTIKENFARYLKK